MPKIEYKVTRFKNAAKTMIDHANEIIEGYMAQDLTLTLRQLYYRFVSENLISNTINSYRSLGYLINEARLSGLIDWLAIEDRSRNLNALPHWNSPSEIIYSAAESYNIDKWEGQKYRVEVWVEKQALEAIIEKAVRPFDCACFACKGYNSQSEMWRSAERFQDYVAMGQIPVIIHLGDHDPSGIDMTRDIKDRLAMFNVPIKVNRIALNKGQVRKYKPPANPAKIKDSRAKDYIAKFGKSSWELDALEPKILHDLIQKSIKKYLNMTKFNKQKKKQEKERKKLTKLANDWM